MGVEATKKSEYFRVSNWSVSHTPTMLGAVGFLCMLSIRKYGLWRIQREFACLATLLLEHLDDLLMWNQGTPEFFHESSTYLESYNQQWFVQRLVFLADR